jgi:hypothetical protein
MHKILNRIGLIFFIAGLVIAFIAGIILPSNAIVILILMLFGIIIGAINVTSKELIPLLIASAALIIVGTSGFEPLNEIFIPLGDIVNGIINYIARLMAPAAIIAAVRQFIIVARPGD